MAFCYEAATGKVLWQERLGRHHASPVLIDGLVFFINDDGEINVIKPGAKFDRVAQVRTGRAVLRLARDQRRPGLSARLQAPLLHRKAVEVGFFGQNSDTLANAAKREKRCRLPAHAEASLERKTHLSAFSALTGRFANPFPACGCLALMRPPLCFSSAVQIMRALAKRSAEGELLMSWTTVAVAVHVMVELAVIIRVMLRPHREPASRIAWVAVVTALPVIGILAYILFGEVNIGRRRVARMRKVLERMPDVAGAAAGDEANLKAVVPERYEHLFRLGAFDQRI